MGDMADYALDQMMSDDEAQLCDLGYSRVFFRLPLPSRCPACGGRMVERKGRYGPFLGCENFPQCRQGPTVSLNAPQNITR